MDRRILYLGIGGLVVLAVAGLLLQLAFGGSGNGTVTLIVVPASATVQIDGQAAQAGTIKFSAGTHSVTASANGYISKTITFNVKSDSQTNQSIVLQPTAANLIKQQLGEAAAGQQASQQGQIITANNPILKHLPYGATGFQIDFGQSKVHPNDPNVVALYITTVDQAGRDAALSWIRSQGVDPSKYEIIYQ